MLKVYRRLQQGIHPEIEMSRFLLNKGFANTPKFLGMLEYVDSSGISSALAVAHEYVINQGDGWDVTLRFLKALLERRFDEDPLPIYAQYSRILGRRLAEMHSALLAARDDPAFAPEDVQADELRAWAEDIARSASINLDLLQAVLPALGTEQANASALVARREELTQRIAEAARSARPTVKTRIHGDFHLGQVLVVTEDVLIVDLEGETQLPFELRRRKHAQLRDVAGMLRSFDYAAVHSLMSIGPERLEENADTFRADIERWRNEATHAFLSEYEAASGRRIDSDLLDLFT
ncbi:MAG: phosphotransferase, partial [Vulcanimicrobiaceae bacterium]